MTNKIADLVRRIFSHSFVSWLMWLAGAQVINRVFRLAATIVIARILVPEAYGLLAIIFTVHELVFVIMRRSTQVRLVQVQADEIEQLCQTSYTLNWFISITLFVVQIIAAACVSVIYDNSALFLPICAMALVYLQLPFAMVQTALNLREGRVNIVAKIDMSQSFFDALISILLVFMGWGIWGVVLAKVLVTPLWIYFHRKYCAWRPTLWISLKGWKQIFSYSSNVIADDLLMTLRNNIDYLLIGYVWGVEALGIYFFAYNAGLGISMSLQHAIGAALMPYLSKVKREAGQIIKSFALTLGVSASLTAMLVLLQTQLAHWYVPHVFGEQWVNQGVIPMLVLLCWSAIPRVCLETLFTALRVQHQPALVLKLNLLLSIVLIAGIIITVPFGMVAVIWTILIVHIVMMCVVFWWAKGHILSLNSNESEQDICHSISDIQTS